MGNNHFKVPLIQNHMTNPQVVYRKVLFNHAAGSQKYDLKHHMFSQLKATLTVVQLDSRSRMGIPAHLKIILSESGELLTTFLPVKFA